MFPLDARVYRRRGVRRRDLMVCGCVREGPPSEAKAGYGSIPNGTIGRGCGKTRPIKENRPPGLKPTLIPYPLFSPALIVFPQPLKSCPSRLVHQSCSAGVPLEGGWPGRDSRQNAGATGRAAPGPTGGGGCPHITFYLFASSLSAHSISAVRALECPYGNLSSRGGCRSRPWRGPEGGRGRIGLR
jgi:hypothetical protein